MQRDGHRGSIHTIADPTEGSRAAGNLARAGPRSYIIYLGRFVWAVQATRNAPDAHRGHGHIMNLLTTLLLIAMLATLGALAVGLAGFFHGGEFNRKYGNKLMQARVALQAVAVFLLLMLLLGVGQS
jgi:Hypoxia induced protein conserved region